MLNLNYAYTATVVVIDPTLETRIIYDTSLLPTLASPRYLFIRHLPLGSLPIISIRTSFSRLISDACFSDNCVIKRWSMSLTRIRNTFVFIHVVSHVPNSLWDKQTRAAYPSQILYGKNLKRNNIDIDKDMLSFYISKCLDEHRETYDLNDQLSPMCFQPIFQEMHVNNFGRIMAYLALVYKVSDSYYEETLREAVRRTV